MALEAYFSHSGREKDVPLNVFVWQTVAQDCVLYVDRDGAEKGAYYINRLEELIRKSDVFISVLAHRTKPTPNTEARPDYRLNCSHWALFEIRLAERARKPRWIVFDDRTGFIPPDTGSGIVVYTPICDFRGIGARWKNHTECRRWLAATGSRDALRFGSGTRPTSRHLD